MRNWNLISTSNFQISGSAVTSLVLRYVTKFVRSEGSSNQPVLISTITRVLRSLTTWIIATVCQSGSVQVIAVIVQAVRYDQLLLHSQSSVFCEDLPKPLSDHAVPWQ